MSDRVAVVEAKRTPIGRFLGSFSNFSAVELGTASVRSVLDSGGVNPDEVDELIYGNARQAGSGPNPARQVAFHSGIPQGVPSYTVNKACGSGMKAIALGFDAIKLQRAACVVAGGTENMTKVPFILDNARLGYRLGHAKLLDGMYKDGLFCPMSEMVMGQTVELLAEDYNITREEQDEWALLSQNRVEAADRDGIWMQEMIAVTAADKRGKPVEVIADEHPRKGIKLESLAKLPAVFKKDGTITAGNASGITDGAATVVLMSESKAREAGKMPLAFIKDYISVGVHPKRMGIGPVPAVKTILERNKLDIGDIDLMELNEAFAAQVLACKRELKLDDSKVNVRGGAISLGHPIGATGTRIVVTLLHEMKRREASLGIATLCISGGLGMALLVERN